MQSASSDYTLSSAASVIVLSTGAPNRAFYTTTATQQMQLQMEKLLEEARKDEQYIKSYRWTVSNVRYFMP